MNNDSSLKIIYISVASKPKQNFTYGRNRSLQNSFEKVEKKETEVDLTNVVGNDQFQQTCK